MPTPLKCPTKKVYWFNSSPGRLDSTCLSGRFMVPCGYETVRLSRSALPPPTPKVTYRCLKPPNESIPPGDTYSITNNLASHKSSPMRGWLATHPRIEQAFILKGAA